jgi:spore coat polysaccharide biosynthesis predicted glycosyltransferase SpsG
VNRNKIILSTEAGFGIGYGHLTRIMALGKALLNEYEVCLHGRVEENSLTHSILNDAGFNRVCGCDLISDLVITDSYNLEILNQFPKSINQKKVSLVDELSPVFHANAYIQASPIRNWKPQNLSAPIKTFQDDPILRDVFQPLSSASELQKNKEGILLLLGSLSPDSQLLLEILGVLNRVSKQNVFLMSNYNIDLGLLKKHNITVLSGDTDFIENVRRMDLIISAAGVTAWELLILNVKCLFFAAAPNQEFQLDYIIDNSLGNGIDLNNFDSRSLKEFEALIRGLLSDHTPFKLTNKTISNGTISTINWLQSQNLIH